MYLKTALFLFCFFQTAQFAHLRDSISINNDITTHDLRISIIKDSLRNEVDSVFTGGIDYLNDSSAVIISGSIERGRDSLAINKEARADIYQQPFSYQSTFISKADILKNDYRYTGDLFKVFPLSFERSYGFVGQPNDIYLYTEGSNSTNYFIDGVPISNTLFYSLDFNQIQSEDIDSIEIVPFPRGFLYGFTTNPVSVNFISKDIIPSKPYSRIKYYEGPFGEAFIDGMFSIYLLKDLYASVDITNRKVDDSYTNSSYSAWLINTKLRYNLSNNINLIGNYYFSKSETGINGGVNVDKIVESTSDINSLLFNETLAPVNFENNSLLSKQHNFDLRVLAKPFENTYTNLNFYHKFYQNEYNERDTSPNSKSTSKDNVLGVMLDQRVSFDPLHLSLQSGYQLLKHNPAFTSSDSLDSRYFLNTSTLEYKSFFVSPLISVALLDSVVVPSIYYKYANALQKNTLSGIETKQTNEGYGADLSIFLNENFNFYLGYSQFDDYYLIWEKTKTFELKVGYNDENNSFTINLFNKKSSSINLWGIGLDVSYQIWKILFEGRGSQYLAEKDSPVNFINIPETKFAAGVYFTDTLFNSNLDLKTGFIFNYTGKQNIRSLPILQWGILSDDVNASLTIDFTVSAEIQKAAIVYFTWENLFDKQYYITPYYPMLERNIRFGVAWEIFN